MKQIIAIFYCICCTFTALAQSNYAVNGFINDTTSNTNLDKVTICVLNAKDSTLENFTYSDRGAFRIERLKPGKFVLMVTYPDYVDFTGDFTLDNVHPVKDFGNIGLMLRSRLLEEVTIKGKVVSIKIKGDTTEFNAAAYLTKKNAKVEDILNQLPGMKIDQSGKIIFQGEIINKILVDGEEFFGDDPTLVSKNVRADMVSRIQVYNQKSDQAKLTGVEDGIKIKTINLQLREDKKKGIFGKADAGYGTDKFYQGQAMFNVFSPKEKIAAYLNAANTGKVGLSGEDVNKYSNGFGGSYDGIGVPSARDGGIHYDSKWNKNKESINANFKAGTLSMDVTGNTFTQNSLPGNFNKSTQNKISHSYQFNQTINIAFISQLDSNSSLSTKIIAGDGNGTSINENKVNTVRGNNILLNTGSINTNNKDDNKNLSAYINYFKSFKKKRRNLSLYTSTSVNQSNTNNYLSSVITYYNGQGRPDSINTIDQYKPGTNKNTTISAGFSYNEPLSKFVTLTATYGLSQNINDDYKGSFNKSLSNLYDSTDLPFTSRFRLTTISNTYDFKLGYAKSKSNFFLGATIINNDLTQDNKLTDSVLGRRFVNLQPYGYFNYQLNKSAAITFTYSGGPDQPTFYQLQPLKQNSDPLNIIVGNPNLKPAFHNVYILYYRIYQPTLDRGFNLKASFLHTTNAIINNRYTDSTGINTNQWSNLQNRQPTSLKGYAEFYGHVTKFDINLSIVLAVNESTSFNYINNLLNEAKLINYSPGIRAWKNKTNYRYSFDFQPNFIVNTTSLQMTNNNSNSHGFTSGLSFYTKLPNKFYIGADANYQYTAKNQVFDHEFTRFLLKTYIGRSFFKDENLKIAITGNDLLNQNTGYSRNGTLSNYTEERYNTIKRYFIISATWDLSKFGKSMQK
jgi:hypothetical protein